MRFKKWSLALPYARPTTTTTTGSLVCVPSCRTIWPDSRRRVRIAFAVHQIECRRRRCRHRRRRRHRCRHHRRRLPVCWLSRYPGRVSPRQPKLARPASQPLPGCCFARTNENERRMEQRAAELACLFVCVSSSSKEFPLPVR